jgi:hypothetical protein
MSYLVSRNVNWISVPIAIIIVLNRWGIFYAFSFNFEILTTGILILSHTKNKHYE